MSIEIGLVPTAYSALDQCFFFFFAPLTGFTEIHFDGPVFKYSTHPVRQDKDCSGNAGVTGFMCFSQWAFVVNSTSI